MVRLLARLALATALLAPCFPAHAQGTKAAVQSTIGSNLPDNSLGLITPAIVRSTLDYMTNSWQQYVAAPRVVTTTTDTLLSTDYGGVVQYGGTSPVAVTLPQATGSFAVWNVFVQNTGTAVATITPTTSTINGQSSVSLYPGQFYQIVSNGTNYTTYGCQVPTSSTLGCVEVDGVTIAVSGAGSLSLAPVAANSLLGNFTGSTATPGTAALVNCVGAADALNYSTSTHAFTCNSVVGSGTVNSGTSGELAYYASSTNAVSGTPAAVISGGALSLGSSGTAGSVSMGNTSSGTVTLQPVAGALGTVTASLPANTGTVAELNLAQSWTAAQTFTNSDILLRGSSTGTTTLSSANASATSYTLTLPANTGTVAELNLAQLWTAAQTFAASGIVLDGSSTGATTITSANASATNYTMTLPANTGTVAELNLAETFTAAQTFTNSDILILGSSSGATTISSANASATNYTMTLPANTGTVAELNLAQSWTAAQTFAASGIVLNGSSSGTTTISSANSSATSYTLTLPATTDTVSVLGTNQTLSATETFSGTLNVSGTFQVSGHAMTFPSSAATLAGLGTAETWTAAQTFTNSDVLLLGSSTGTTTIASANSSATNYTLTLPAITDTVATLTATQALTGKTYNGLTVTTSTGTLTIANGKTATVNNSLTFAGTDATTMTFPATSTTLIGSTSANTWTGTQTFAASGIVLDGSSTGATTFTSANSGASNFTLTFPAVTDTVTTNAATQTLTNKTITTSGALTISASGANQLNVQTSSGATSTQIAIIANTHNTAGDTGIIIGDGASGADSASVVISFANGGNTVGVGSITRTGTNNVAYNTSSDQRLKTDLGTPTGALETLRAIKVHDFSFKADHRHRRHNGYFAQELYKVYPDAVFVGGADPIRHPWMVDYGRLTPLLVRAVQELAERNKSGLHRRHHAAR